MRPIHCPVVVVFVSLLLPACGVDRKLKITEVAPNTIELYLDEPSGNQLDLTNMKFKWVSQDPMAQPKSGEVDLGLAGTLQGGTFLMIFEGSNYSGPPVAQNFHNQIPGIKVKDNFFPGYGQNPSVSMSVDGKHYRTYIVFVPIYRDTVNDVVRFGPRPRPNLFGVFNEDGSLDGLRPVGTQSIGRAFSNGIPVDTDSEADWSRMTNSPAAGN
jgi:hypothetical protein